MERIWEDNHRSVLWLGQLYFLPLHAQTARAVSVGHVLERDIGGPASIGNESAARMEAAALGEKQGAGDGAGDDVEASFFLSQPRPRMEQSHSVGMLWVAE